MCSWASVNLVGIRQWYRWMWKMKPIYMQKKKKKRSAVASLWRWRGRSHGGRGGCHDWSANKRTIHICRTWKTCEWLGQAATTWLACDHKYVRFWIGLWCNKSDPRHMVDAVDNNVHSGTKYVIASKTRRCSSQYPTYFLKWKLNYYLFNSRIIIYYK